MADRLSSRPVGNPAPTLWLIAGPNGVGKTTYAFRHIRQVSGSVRFVNLDEIARGLSPLDPDAGRIEASRVALRQIRNWLAVQNGDAQSFSLETTLAGLTHLRVLSNARARGWQVRLLYFAVRDPEICLQRIARRVAEGGHNVPEADARRRFRRSIENFPAYLRLVDHWQVFDNNQLGSPRVVAEGRAGCQALMMDSEGLPPRLRQQISSLLLCAGV